MAEKTPSPDSIAGTLHVTIHVGETVQIDSGPATITLLEKSGQSAKLRVTAHKTVKVGIVTSDKPKAHSR